LKPSTPTTIADLNPDPTNARSHSPRNIGMLVDSLQQLGASRSIVIDEEGTVLAGNGVVEAAAEAGITKVRVVDVAGDELVAVRRTGLTPEQKVDLALRDNRVLKAGLPGKAIELVMARIDRAATATNWKDLWRG